MHNFNRIGIVSALAVGLMAGQGAEAKKADAGRVQKVQEDGATELRDCYAISDDVDKRTFTALKEIAVLACEAKNGPGTGSSCAKTQPPTQSCEASSHNSLYTNVDEVFGCATRPEVWPMADCISDIANRPEDKKGDFKLKPLACDPKEGVFKLKPLADNPQDRILPYEYGDEGDLDDRVIYDLEYREQRRIDHFNDSTVTRDKRVSSSSTLQKAEVCAEELQRDSADLAGLEMIRDRFDSAVYWMNRDFNQTMDERNKASGEARKADKAKRSEAVRGVLKLHREGNRPDIRK